MPEPDLRRVRLLPLSLGQRLAVGFSALLGLLVAVVALAGWHLRSVQAEAQQMSQGEMPRMLAMQELVQHAQGHGAAMARLLTAPRAERERIYPALDGESAAIDQLMAKLQPQFSDAQSRRVLTQLDEARLRYRAVFAEVGTWIESGDAATAASLFAGDGQAALSALVGQARELLAHQQAAVSRRQAEMATRIGRAELQLALLAGLGLALAVALAWRTTRSVSAPMQQMEAAARRLAGGDYATRIELRASREIERVAGALNDMARAVAERGAEIERIAFSDPLTGLPNRALLRRLAEAPTARGPAPHFALVLDLARLGTVNDVLGFAAGDQLLGTVARRLDQALQAQTLLGAERWLAALPGGLFVVAGRGLGRESVDALRAQLLALVARPVRCDGHDVDVQFTCGLAASDEALDIDRLVRHAEEAAVQARQQRQPHRWHEPDDPALRLRQLGLLTSLQAAAASGQLEMWLQPKQRLGAAPGAAAGDATDGFEALVRWRHPQWGFVSPADFVPFAERAGHVHVITQAMIDAALAALARWQTVRPELTIAVNVSTADLLDEGFVARVVACARAHGAPLARLRLEITESRLMSDADRALPAMQALRAHGVQWSIDDFGTGYSSLSYLQRLPVSELKIDRSFVDHADTVPERRALLRTIIEMGHGLHMSVTAEGVERAEEMALLRELGCDLAQGYHVARPMALEAAQRWVGVEAVESGRAPVGMGVATG